MKRAKCKVPGCRRKCSGVRPVCNDHWWRLSDAARARFWNAYQNAVHDSPQLAAAIDAIRDELGATAEAAR